MTAETPNFGLLTETSSRDLTIPPYFSRLQHYSSWVCYSEGPLFRLWDESGFGQCYVAHAGIEDLLSWGLIPIIHGQP
jgi:hypothetical protein